MDRLLDTPLLPQGRVTAVAVGSEHKEIISALKKRGVECFEIPSNPLLSEPVSSHADCMLIQLGRKTFVADESITENLKIFLNSRTGKNNIVNNLTNRAGEFEIKTERVKSPYPNDIKLNVKVIGNSILCNTRFISKHITDFAKNNGYQLIHTNQGYSACSSVLLNNSTVLTDDESIYDACNRTEIFATMIGKGQIKLKGLNYGFIGGCCGFIDKNLLAFTGRLDSLNDCNIILNMLKANEIEYIELTDDVMTDIGGIIPVTEELLY